MPAAKIEHENGRTIIADVPPLVWGKSGETSFCGALRAALVPMGVRRGYAELMDDSSLAFRVRWWHADAGAAWSPAGPVGEFPPWDKRAAASCGVKVRFDVHLDGKTDMAAYAKDVAASIDAGRPVLIYAKALDMGVAYGYADGGAAVLVRDYYVGDAETVLPLSATKGLLGFLEPAGDAPSPRDRAAKAIENAVADWQGTPETFRKPDGTPGTFLLGDAAYTQWIADLKLTDVAEKPLKNMFQVNWWTFDVLADARQAAVGYLTAVAPLFDGESRSALERAAGFYGKSVAMLGGAFAAKDAFIGPWSGKTVADWDTATRGREVERLTAVRASDAAAIAELEKALKSIAHRTRSEIKLSNE